MQLGPAKALSGIRGWQRDAVVGAALRSFCSWMVTYTDAAIAAFARLALSLAAAGCPWIQAEAQRILQVCCSSACLYAMHLNAMKAMHAETPRVPGIHSWRALHKVSYLTLKSEPRPTIGIVSPIGFVVSVEGSEWFEHSGQSLVD